MSDTDATEGDEVRSRHPLRNWRTPLMTAVGMSAAVALVAVVDPQPGPLVLAAVLAMTLLRNRLMVTWRGRLEAIILLPIIGLATAGVAYLFVHVPIVAAAAYVAALFLSIWLRRFGPTWFRVGSLIALPFITLLIAPGAGVGTTPLGVALLSVVVVILVIAIRVLAQATRFIPSDFAIPSELAIPSEIAQTRASHAAPARTATVRAANAVPANTAPTSRGSMRPIASTRMAIQMAIALTAAFVLGFTLFPHHWPWVVLTAFIVCSGNRGRADVVYKSGLRVVGAAVGTIIATIDLAVVPATGSWLEGPLLVVVLLVIIAIGLWLREWTYAAWAVGMTLVITLIQGAVVSASPASVVQTPEGSELWLRILGIIVGAVCGIAASWFVLPVRSEGVVRRRVANALAALSDFAASPDPLTDHDLAVSLDKLDEVAKPWAAWERLTARRRSARKPGQWMTLVDECAQRVRSNPQLSPAARKALGEARRSMRDPDAIGPALATFRDELRA